MPYLIDLAATRGEVSAKHTVPGVQPTTPWTTYVQYSTSSNAEGFTHTSDMTELCPGGGVICGLPQGVGTTTCVRYTPCRLIVHDCG
jgi:hypothetical protein